MHTLKRMQLSKQSSHAQTVTSRTRGPHVWKQRTCHDVICRTNASMTTRQVAIRSKSSMIDDSFLDGSLMGSFHERLLSFRILQIAFHRHSEEAEGKRQSIASTKSYKSFPCRHDELPCVSRFCLWQNLQDNRLSLEAPCERQTRSPCLSARFPRLLSSFISICAGRLSKNNCLLCLVQHKPLACRLQSAACAVNTARLAA